MSKLERQWWFAGLVAGLATLATIQLFKAAQYLLPFGSEGTVSRYVVFMLCLVALQRMFSFAIWLAVLTVAPKIARGEA